MEQSASNDALLQQQMIAQLEKRVADLDNQELSLWDKYTQDAMPRHIFEKLKEKLEQDRREAREALAAAREAAPQRIDYQKRRATFHAALEAMQTPTSSVREINLLLKECIERIVYSRKTKEAKSRRYGTPEPIELTVHLRT